MTKKIMHLLLLACVLFPSCTTVSESGKRPHLSNLPERTILLGEREVHVQVATTDQEKQQGLMGQKHLDKDAGMLFIYNRNIQPRFWMKNTNIPLSVGFFDNTKTLIEIRHMTPFSQDHIVPKSPIRFALEVNQGWFEKNNIKLGDRFSFKKNDR